MDPKFIDSLDEEQRNNLGRVLEAAKKYGVDPRLAASLAYTESQLRQNKDDKVLRGTSGEFGIMQVKPSTGKLMGYEVNQLSDLDANIDAGMKYLKQSLDKHGDPVLGAIGYNAGPDHPFFQGKANPPEQSVKYVNRIRELGGFSGTPETETQAETPVETPVETQETPGTDGRTMNAALMGGAAGTGLGLTQSAVNAVLGGRRPPVPTLPDMGGPESRILQGTTGDAGTTGRARMQGFNVETAQGAARAKEAEKMFEGLQKRGIVARSPQSILSQAPGLTSSPSGVLYPRGTEFPTAPAPPGPGPLSRMAGAAAPLLQSPVVRYGLGGAGIAGGAQEFGTRREQKDVPGQVLAGAGGLGSAMMMTRIPGVSQIGAGMALSSPLALAVLDRMREMRSRPPGPKPTPEEFEQAQRPSFLGARP